MNLGTRKLLRVALLPLSALLAVTLVFGTTLTTVNAAEHAAALDNLEDAFARYHSGPDGGETIDDLSGTNFGMLLDPAWVAYYTDLLDEMIAIAAVLAGADDATLQQLGADLDEGAEDVKAGIPNFDAGGRITSGITILLGLVEPNIAAAQSAAGGAAAPADTPAPVAAPDTGNAGLSVESGAGALAMLGLAALMVAALAGGRLATGRVR